MKTFYSTSIIDRFNNNNEFFKQMYDSIFVKPWELSAENQDPDDSAFVIKRLRFKNEDLHQEVVIPVACALVFNEDKEGSAYFPHPVDIDDRNMILTQDVIDTSDIETCMGKIVAITPNNFPNIPSGDLISSNPDTLKNSLIKVTNFFRDAVSANFGDNKYLKDYVDSVYASRKNEGELKRGISVFKKNFSSEGFDNVSTINLSRKEILGLLLCYERNVIISGAPGVGKSYLVSEYIIPFLTGNRDNDENKCVERITFTPGTIFEDFWGSYKPISIDGSIDYKFQAGPAAAIIKRAIDHPTNTYVLVIEELNRAQVYDVFGFIFQLLDRTESGVSLPRDAYDYFEEKSGKNNSNINEDVKLREENIKRIKLPENLYIICTMNPADQNVTTLDTAFLRRFSVGYIDINGKLWCSWRAPIELSKFDKDYFNEGSVQPGMPRSDVIKTINDGLKIEGKTDDKLLSEYFVSNSASDFEFFIKIMNYLLSIYREPQMWPSFVDKRNDEETGFRLSTMLERYEKNGWTQIFIN